MLPTPVDRSGASVRFMMRSRIGLLSGPLWPSLNKRQVGIHIFSFEACSSFTHVTAYGFARPPKVDFVTRLPSRPLTRRSGSSAIQSYRQLLERDFHPLVICAFEAHVCLFKKVTL